MTRFTQQMTKCIKLVIFQKNCIDCEIDNRLKKKKCEEDKIHQFPVGKVPIQFFHHFRACPRGQKNETLIDEFRVPISFRIFLVKRGLKFSFLKTTIEFAISAIFFVEIAKISIAHESPCITWTHWI